MGTTWLMVRRIRSRSGLLAVMATMTALVTLAVAGVQSYLAVAAVDGLRDAVDEAGEGARSAVLQTRQAEGAEAAGEQREIAQQAIAAALPADAQLHVDVRSVPQNLLDRDGSLVLGTDSDIAGHAAVIEGSWEGWEGEATREESESAFTGALHAGAAESLGVRVGDSLRLPGAAGADLELVITALWRPRDPEAWRWDNDPLRTGVDPLDEGTVGTMLVSAEALEHADTTPFARWTITATETALRQDTLEQWHSGLDRAQDALRDSGVTVRGQTMTGELATTLSEADEGLAAVRAATAIPLAVAVAVSLVALAQLARLVAVVRERETGVLLARGASRGQLRMLGAVEGLLTAVPGALLGAAVVLAALGGRDGFRLTPVLVTALLAASATFAVHVTVQARAAAHAARGGETGRVVRVAQPVLLVGGAGAAGYAMWHFRRTGSPLIPGSNDIDVISVVAPALAMFVLALLAAGAIGPLTALLARLGAARRALSPVLELRQVSRRITVGAVPVVLVAMAAAVVTLVASYTGTWQSMRTSSAQVLAGADVRVELGSGRISAGRAQPEVSGIAGLPSVSSAAPVLRAPLAAEDEEGAAGMLVALPVDDLDVLRAPLASIGPEAAATALNGQGITAVPLPGGAGMLEFELRGQAQSELQHAHPGQREVTARVWLRDEGGQLHLAESEGSLELIAADSSIVREVEGSTGQLEGRETIVELDGVGEEVTSTLSVELPELAGAEIVALDLQVEVGAEATSFELSIDALRAAGQDLLDGSEAWTLRTPFAVNEGEAMTSDPAGHLAASGTLSAPMVAVGGGSLAPPTIRNALPAVPLRFFPGEPAHYVPVLATPGLPLTETGTRMRVAGVPVELRPVDRLELVPGAPSGAAALSDLATVHEVLLSRSDSIPATSEIWAEAAHDPAVTAAEVQRHAGAGYTVLAAGDGSADGISRPALGAYWAAAAAAILLALPAVGAVVLTQLEARRGEVVVLRAAGAGSSHQARSRRREILGLTLTAVVTGAAAGLLVSAAIVVPLVRSTTPDVSAAVPMSMQVSAAPALAVLGGIALLLMVMGRWYGRAVRRQALDTTWREEVR
ncbi:FtsX-like permease family protein [Bogoriella caseilytica]|uniref:ABC3 transporter permease C-terminal domain-containing protein n=1 Tax=Bogoriella caseilytica TaxID=56055 RepID=A0A3N2BBF3_9MICO|nr:FtsX-like permease family protein [Bogoriella caseilytica]ROR72577.1 hypothetical protein EDD31_0932 [Bogoriella caseilytica]